MHIFDDGLLAGLCPDQFGQLSFLIILARVANVVDTLSRFFNRRIQCKADRFSNIANMNIWPPELLAENHQFAVR